MLEFWQHLPQHINPVIFSIGFFSFRWYSLMYLLAFSTVWYLIRWRIYFDPSWQISRNRKESLEILMNFMLYAIIGLLLGARIGYALFYEPNLLLDPLRLFSPFQNNQFTGIYGMSFHGGLLGAVLAAIIFAKKHHYPLNNLLDYILPAIPLGYFFGRIGNFLNGELYGKGTTAFWGMYFPSDNLAILRHPTQLYEALGEGILIFLILWPIRNRLSLQGKFLPLFILLYGAIRFVIEFYRVTDPTQYHSIFSLQLTIAQLLCLGMIITGMITIKYKIAKVFDF